ncbi:hypothetical protein Ntsu_40800 [Nocardia sp. IFM 10818]
MIHSTTRLMRRTPGIVIRAMLIGGTALTSAALSQPIASAQGLPVITGSADGAASSGSADQTPAPTPAPQPASRKHEDNSTTVVVVVPPTPPAPSTGSAGTGSFTGSSGLRY